MHVRGTKVESHVVRTRNQRQWFEFLPGATGFASALHNKVNRVEFTLQRTLACGPFLQSSAAFNHELELAKNNCWNWPRVVLWSNPRQRLRAGSLKTQTSP
nr:MetaGeneMark_Unknown Function [uncultured bacterium]